MNAKKWKEELQVGAFDTILSRLYGEEHVAAQKERYCEAIDAFTAQFGEQENLRVFSAPGRTEICGNHTDHNYGRVVAASVDLDVIAIVSANDSGIIRVQSKGFPMGVVDTRELDVIEGEFGHSPALIRGVAARFTQLGHKIGGFDAYTTSNVLKGSGLSSSAAFEVLIGTILNGLYNDNTVSPVVIAQVAQYAENVYFGKPSGLMDQMASSVGSAITIDFADPQNPEIRQLPFDLGKHGYALCIVDTGGNHADLTHEYAAVPQEMKDVAALFEKEVLRPISEETILAHAQYIREKCGDRALLRALHFIRENDRVNTLVNAIADEDLQTMFDTINESGRSSFCYLQNVYPASHPEEQGLSLALAVADSVLKGVGARRVHGGGFGGTTQNFVPQELVPAFTEAIEQVFGSGSCHILSIRPCGGVELMK